MGLEEKRVQVREWILAEGMRSQGSRYGKAGEFFYAPGDAAPARAISLGSRELLLNVYNITANHGRYDERWGMSESVLITKVTPETVKKCVAWAKRGPTRKEIREKADQQSAKRDVAWAQEQGFPAP
jgi:hypothetical protein